MKRKHFEFDAKEREILERLPVTMQVFQFWEDERRLILVTDDYCNTFHTDREKLNEFYNVKKKTLAHSEDNKRIRMEIDDVIHSPVGTADVTMRLRSINDKRYRWYRVHMRTERIADDSVLIYNTFTDVTDVQTEIKQKEDENARADVFLENILNIAPVAIFWKDTKRRFLGANTTFLEYFGYASVDEILGKTDQEIGWHKDDVNFENDELRALQGEVTYLAHGKCIAKGRERNIAVCKAPYYVNNKIAGMVGSFLDVTETFEQEQQIGRLNKMLNESLEHEKEINRSTNEFMSRLSHEIRTPMNAIIGLSNIGIRSAENPVAKDYLMKINSSGQYLLGIINDVLDLRKIEGGEITLNETRMSLSEMLGAVNTMIEPLASDKNIKYTVDDKKVKERIAVADHMRIQQILINLLNNAVKFTDPGGEVKLTITQKLHEHEMLITFIVEDNGCGMRPEFLSRIFGSFAQENRNPAKYGTGTGLGLSISRKFARMMGGDITVRSTDGVGSTFTVTVVLKRTSQDADDMASSGAGDTDLSVLKKTHVLLAEDNEINVEVAKGILEHVEIQVETAANGLQAIELYTGSKEGYYDAILMDLQMPVIDGFKAAEAIRSLGRSDSTSIPIIAMSADIFPETVEQAKGSGMNDYISKPIEVATIYRVLSNEISAYRKDKRKKKK